MAAFRRWRGIIDMETMRVVDQAKRAASFGVDALVATAPFYALGGPKEVERHFRAIREYTDLPLFAYDLPCCVHTKLSPEMLMRLGKDGVIQGVKDSSGDDVNFRWLVLENEEAGHPMQLLTGHEVVVDGAHSGRAPTAACPGWQTWTPTPMWRCGRLRRRATGIACASCRTIWPGLMFVTRDVRATVGFGAGVGAFKTALWQMGVLQQQRDARAGATAGGR